MINLYRGIGVSIVDTIIILSDKFNDMLVIWYDKDDGSIDSVKKFSKPEDFHNLIKINNISRYKDVTLQQVLIEVINHASNSTT